MSKKKHLYPLALGIQTRIYSVSFWYIVFNLNNYKVLYFFCQGIYSCYLKIIS